MPSNVKICVLIRHLHLYIVFIFVSYICNINGRNIALFVFGSAASLKNSVVCSSYQAQDDDDADDEEGQLWEEDGDNHDDIGVGGGEDKHDYNGDDNYDDADKLLTLMFIIIDNIVLMVIL